MHDPEMSLDEAAKIADERGADVAYVGEDAFGFDYIEVDGQFVEDELDVDTRDVFLLDGVYGSRESGTFVFLPNRWAGPCMIREYDEDEVRGSTEWSKGDYGHSALWVNWLRGNVTPVEPTYHRVDTGEEVEL